MMRTQLSRTQFWLKVTYSYATYSDAVNILVWQSFLGNFLQEDLQHPLPAGRLRSRRYHSKCVKVTFDVRCSDYCIRRKESHSYQRTWALHKVVIKWYMYLWKLQTSFEILNSRMVINEGNKFNCQKTNNILTNE